ncbi:hypothetical protein EB72_24805 [Mycobacterium sp. SWH-M1]|nr:hypothetical protein EB72_24805 [Mycobacterium sp. SWH-M1]
MKLVVIEFTKDTFTVDEDGDEIPQRVMGQRARVDERSARSFVDDLKVAKYVDTENVAPKTKAKTAKPPVTTDEGDQTA